MVAYSFFVCLKRGDLDHTKQCTGFTFGFVLRDYWKMCNVRIKLDSFSFKTYIYIYNILYYIT